MLRKEDNYTDVYNTITGDTPNSTTSVRASAIRLRKLYPQPVELT